MLKVLWRLSTLCVAVIVMGVAPSTNAASAPNGHPDLVWFNAQSGVVSAWLLNGTGTVQGKADLNWTCGAECWNGWSPIGIGDLNADGHSDLVWFNAQSGAVGAWLLNGTGTVQGR